MRRLMAAGLWLGSVMFLGSVLIATTSSSQDTVLRAWYTAEQADRGPSAAVAVMARQKWPKSSQGIPMLRCTTG